MERENEAPAERVSPASWTVIEDLHQSLEGLGLRVHAHRVVRSRWLVQLGQAVPPSLARQSLVLPFSH